jgi:hypothetical protein
MHIMKKNVWSLFAFAMVMLNLDAGAAFAPPTAAQIREASTNSALVAQLIQGASAEQSAEFVKLVVNEIAGLELDGAARGGLIQAAVASAITATSENARAPFIAALGRGLARSGLAERPEVISSVQAAIAGFSAGNARQLAEAFGLAFKATRAGRSGVGGGPQAITTAIQQPPVEPKPAPTYNDQ